jgi:outer membrane protein TolC
MSLLLAVLIAAAPADVAPPEFFAGNDELRAYLVEAAENSPELQGLYAEWKAAMARIPQAKSLDDPQLTYTQFLKSDLTRFGVELMQMFPWFGTLKARGDQATAEADAALERLYGARNRLFEDVKTAYHDYAFLGQSIDTTHAEAKLLSDMEDNVTSRYGVGLAAEADVLRVQIEQSRLEDQYNQFLQQRASASARLAALLGREAAKELPWPKDVELPPPPPPAPVVLAQLRLKNPALTEMDRVIKGREVGIDLAKRKRYPNVTVGLGFNDMKPPEKMPAEWPSRAYVEGGTQLLRTGKVDAVGIANDIAMDETIKKISPKPDPMSDEVMVSVGVNVPIWRKRINGGIEEAKQMEQAAVSEKRSRILTLEVEAREALFQMHDARRRYDLYTDVLIPRSRQAYESLQSKYSAGDKGTTFLDVLGGVQEVLNYELERLRARRDLMVGGARLERIMGGPWRTEEGTKSEE